MGADIYLMSLFRPNRDLIQPQFLEACEIRNQIDSKRYPLEYHAAQEKVSVLFARMHEVGYYRESYTGFGLVNMLGLSWWELTDELGTEIDHTTYLMPAACKTLLEEIDRRYREFAPVCYEKVLEMDPSAKQESAAQIRGWYGGQYERFTTLLRQAIQLNEGLVASV